MSGIQGIQIKNLQPTTGVTSSGYFIYYDGVKTYKSTLQEIEDLIYSGGTNYDFLMSNGTTLRATDNLTGTTSYKPLSENQGRVLDNKILTIQNDYLKTTGGTITGDVLISGDTQIEGNMTVTSDIEVNGIIYIGSVGTIYSNTDGIGIRTFNGDNITISNLGLVLPQTISPTGTTDPRGVSGTILYDNEKVYIKTGSGWKYSTLVSL